jgi:murein DD-endopeptidase MepM/ murein hydrolase activator NlpD
MKYYAACFLIILNFFVAFSSNLSPFRPKFVPPLNIPLILSGNFGEIRSNHFHSGLDIKTQHRIGLPVFAMADGYVSRIRVTAGSGYMLDIAYGHGISSIYRHLDGFVDAITAITKKVQYAKQRWEVDFTLKPSEYPVKAGEQVAWSGNTGFSGGPHLHMDMYRTASKEYIDPLPFLKPYIKDHRKPQAVTLQIFPQEGLGEVNGTARPHIFAFGNTINAWGKIGIAVKAFDHIDETWYCMGVRYVTLLQDGKKIFSSDIKRCSPAESKMIYAWTYNSYMKSFIDPGNTLRMLTAYNGDRGYVTINQERDYHFEYQFCDVFGNRSSYKFVVHGKKQAIPKAPVHTGILLAWDKTNYVVRPGMALVVPFGVLHEDVYLNYKILPSKSGISYKYQLNYPHIPMSGTAELEIKLRKKPVADINKYYIVKWEGNAPISTKNRRVQKDAIVSKIKALGTYSLMIDQKPPHIMPVNQGSWNRGKLVFSITDMQSGIKSYRGYIDGKFAIFDQTVKNTLVKCEVDPARVQRGKTHICTMVVEDICGNIAKYNKTFKW